MAGLTWALLHAAYKKGLGTDSLYNGIAVNYVLFRWIEHVVETKTNDDDAMKGLMNGDQSVATAVCDYVVMSSIQGACNNHS